MTAGPKPNTKTEHGIYSSILLLWLCIKTINHNTSDIDAAVYIDLKQETKDTITGLSLCLAVYICQGDCQAAAPLSIEPLFGQYFYKLKSALPLTIALLKRH